MTENVLQHIEWYKTQKPSTHAREIRDRRISKGLSDENNAPSTSAIAHSLRWELNQTRKRLTVTPAESLTPAAIEKQKIFRRDLGVSRTTYTFHRRSQRYSFVWKSD